MINILLKEGIALEIIDLLVLLILTLIQVSMTALLELHRFKEEESGMGKLLLPILQRRLKSIRQRNKLSNIRRNKTAIS